MTNKEAIDTIKHAIAEVEWTYPMDYAAAFDKAVEALKEQEAVAPIKARQGRNEYYSYFLCPVCKNDIMFHQSYCEDCGRKMKWDEDRQTDQSLAGLGGENSDAGEVQTADRSRRPSGGA